MSSFRTGSEGGIFPVIPYFLLLLFVLLEGIPVNIFAISRLELGLCFVPLFFIGLTAENDVAPVIIALIGLLNDILSDMPLGFWASLFVLFYMLSAGQRTILATATFSSYWLTFSVLALIIYFVAYLLSAMLLELPAVSIPLLLSAVVCCMLFPLVYFPLYFFGNRLGGSERG